MTLSALLLLCAVQGAADPAEARALALLRGAADAVSVPAASLAVELRARSSPGLLLELLVDGLPADGDPEGARADLSELQERLVLDALVGGDRAAVQAFLADVRAQAERHERVAAALRLECATGAQGELDPVRALLLMEGSGDSARVQDALERGLCERLAREPELFAALPAFCEGLSSDAAGVVVRVLAKTRSAEGARALRALLGGDAALEPCVLQALAATADLLPRQEALGLAAELRPTLDADDPLRVVAAANALGRLRVPGSIPALIELLESEQAPVARAALAALRAVGGTGLPASPSAWRSWYAAEERWWRERAPELRLALEGPALDVAGRARWTAALGELSAHVLHRDALVPVAAAGLRRPDPGLRVLSCEALGRLGARSALPFLSPHLADPDASVAAAAQRVFEELARVELPRDRERWPAFLREHGIALAPAPADALR